MPTGGTIPVGSQLDHAFPAPDGSSGVTKGHQPGRFRIREDDSGVCRTPEDTPATRFGTVRPRVQIPGPRPISEYDSGVMAGPARAPYHSRITIYRSRSQLAARLGD